MPRFTVEGADKNTGIDVKYNVDGSSSEAVLIEARRKGVLVSSITPHDQPAIPDPPLSPLNYETKPAPLQLSRAAIPTPEYTAIKSIALAFKVFAWICYFLAALIIVLAFLNVLQSGGPPNIAAYIALAVPIVSFIAVGMLFQAGGEVLSAFRDLVRNSFK